MAYRLSVEVRVGEYVFRRVSRVVLESSWKVLGDTCEIALPSAEILVARTGERVPLERVISTGARVLVRLGYNDVMRYEWAGYVKEIQPALPFTLKCEDEMYQLKRKPAISLAWNGTLEALVRRVVPEVALGDVPSITLSNFVLDRATPYQVLAKLKELGLYAYYTISPDTAALRLWVGLPYTDSEQARTRVRYALTGAKSNVRMGGYKLTYRRRDDVRLKAKAVSLLPQNKKIEVEVGDTDGETRSLFYKGITDKAALKVLAEADLAKLKYEGYFGSFEAWGLPYIQHSQVAVLSDEEFPERAGAYLVNEVKTEFGVSGFKREISLGLKVR